MVGGDAQRLDAFGTLRVNLHAEGGMGLVHAGSMATDPPSVFNLNTDNQGSDGIIDLIDVTGNFGTIEDGGPQISTGPGGNVRYLRVGGQVFQDRFFGGGSPTTTVHEPGAVVLLTDDSGAKLLLTPVGNVDNPDFDPDQSEDSDIPSEIAASLTVKTYGIRDSGGVVLMEVVSGAGVLVQGKKGNTDTPARGDTDYRQW